MCKGQEQNNKTEPKEEATGISYIHLCAAPRPTVEARTLKIKPRLPRVRPTPLRETRNLRWVAE